MEEKSILRNKLFDKYFEEIDGVLLEDFVSALSPLTDIWKHFHNILLKNVKGYHPFSNIENILEFKKNNCSYLIIKIGIYNYIVISLDNNIIVKKEDVLNIIDEKIINELEERDINYNDEFLKLYHFTDNIKDINEIINFYLNNKEKLEVTRCLYYKIQIEEAWTYLYIDFASDRAQLGFQTPDQFLYEQLFLYSNLTPMGMQDATRKIGKERMTEMFEQIKNIRIPISYIPDELYQKYLSLKDNDQILRREKKD